MDPGVLRAVQYLPGQLILVPSVQYLPGQLILVSSVQYLPRQLILVSSVQYLPQHFSSYFHSSVGTVYIIPDELSRPLQW